ncbi:hypothetical protein LQ327_12805 [Actinomycetospora endophytica]|uniref:Smu12A n=1 Tax=Actinomycetospora endophytica TaxID=2291215 RepID=A0ABS8P9Q6_9PSEU|nr:hypothetical protein [Actinomycetospora endophytica]MCD2194255.1 hypothetical protein [Actinomycetospora endophytica]
MVGRGHRGRPGGGGRVGRGGRPTSELPGTEDLTAWLAGRLPDGWFVDAPEVTVDREEILVVGELPAPEAGADTDAAARAATAAGRISRFREETREDRMEIARQAEHRYGRKVAWGARISGSDDEDGVEELFTTLSVPVMTRLRQNERRVLDTLVDAGVARSRSEALAWAVALVGEHTEPWLAELREAMSTVDELRARGPRLDGDDEDGAPTDGDAQA